MLAAARQDIESERRYYERAQAGLGARFSRAAAKALRRLQANPEAMQVLDRGVRRWPVEHFPHGVIYVVEPSEIPDRQRSLDR